MNALATTIETPEEKAARLNEELRGKPAQEIIRVALREFGRRLTYVSSFGAESAAMLGLISEVDPEMPIVFIDTGMHFHQTLQYRDTLAAKLGLTDIRTSHPIKEEVKAVDPKGVLNKTDPDACCEVRKVRPLAPALEGFDAWITGRKRFHGGGRVRLPVVEFSGRPLQDQPPDRVGVRRTSSNTSWTATCRAIRWWLTAIPPSAAGPAPCARLTRMTSGQVAGWASRRKSAAYTSNGRTAPAYSEL
jgi:phosphoadenosine phosphosulfate reductase